MYYAYACHTTEDPTAAQYEPESLRDLCRGCAGNRCCAARSILRTCVSAFLLSNIFLLNSTYPKRNYKGVAEAPVVAGSDMIPKTEHASIAAAAARADCDNQKECTQHVLTIKPRTAAGCLSRIGPKCFDSIELKLLYI